MTSTVVIAYDGSPASRAALRWAAADAERRRCALRIVHVTPAPGADPGPQAPAGWSSPPPAAGATPAVATTADPSATAARRVLDQACELSRREHGHLRIDFVSSVGERVPTLLREASDACVLVLGSARARDDLAAGSVTVHLATYAKCPVVVVPETWMPHGVPEVVVGVDGSAGSDAAVAYALRHAEATAGVLTAVLAWSASESTGLTVLKESLASRLEAYPRVLVRELLVHGPAANALVEAAGSANLLVVGSSGRESFPGLLLGSVSQAVLRHAVCPVAVVH